MYTIIRVIGGSAEAIQRYITWYARFEDCSGMWASTYKNDNDAIMWFTYSHDDFGSHVDYVYLAAILEQNTLGTYKEGEELKMGFFMVVLDD